MTHTYRLGSGAKALRVAHIAIVLVLPPRVAKAAIPVLTTTAPVGVTIVALASRGSR